MKSACRSVQLALILSASLLFGLAMAAPPLIQIDGSSTVYPVAEAVAEDFQIDDGKRARITVGISGTGGGFKKFCRGEIDIANASRPISEQEMKECRAAGIDFIELPVAYDALTVVVSPKNDWARSMTVAELAAIWAPTAQGKITRWNQINPAWPNRALELYGPGADSGTFEYFTEAINGRPRATRTDYSASEDDNVLVQGIAHEAGALGYLGYSYYAENRQKLAVVSLSAPGAQAVEPSPESVMNGSYQPLARPIFIYVNARSAARPAVDEFVRFFVRHAEKLAREVRIIPLPAKGYLFALDQFARRVTGSRFGGKNRIGLTIDQLMAMEATNLFSEPDL